MREDCFYKDVCTNECGIICIRYVQMNSLLDLSNLPKNLRTPKTNWIEIPEDADAWKQLNDIRANIEEYVTSGKQLYICSANPGNGKTSWAVRLMLKYFDKTWPNSYDITRGLYVYIPSFYGDIKKFDESRPEYLDRIRDADMVIWDDIGSTSTLTQFEHDELISLLDARMCSGKCNIFTSNIVSPRDLVQIMGGRLASRIYNASDVITFKAKDFRTISRLLEKKEK